MQICRHFQGYKCLCTHYSQFHHFSQRFGSQRKNTLQRSLNIIFSLLHLKYMKGPTDSHPQLCGPKQSGYNHPKLQHSWVVLVALLLPRVSGFHKLTNLQPGIPYPPICPWGATGQHCHGVKWLPGSQREHNPRCVLLNKGDD